MIYRIDGKTVKIPDHVYDLLLNSTLSSAHRDPAIAIVAYWFLYKGDSKGYIHPSRKQIAKASRVSERTVSTVMKKLRDCGVLIALSTLNGGRSFSTRYKVDLDALKGIQDPDFADSKSMKKSNDSNVVGDICPYFIMNDGTKIPNIFSNRASWALGQLKATPEKAQVDSAGLVWLPCEQDGMWYSIAGNYSQYSPSQKIIKQAEYEREQIIKVKEAATYYDTVMYQSLIRQQVLERDEYTCQICGKYADTKLHVHHILKRKEGGTDHLDNLITACPSCHKRADTVLYNPNWIDPRKGVV